MIAGASKQRAGIQPPISDPTVRAAVLAALALYLAADERPSSSPWSAAARAGHSAADGPWRPEAEAWARSERPR